MLARRRQSEASEVLIWVLSVSFYEYLSSLTLRNYTFFNKS